jgi:hypothetical protein
VGGTTGSGVTGDSVTSLLVTSDRVTGPPGVVGDILLIDDGGDALLIDDATSDNRLIED